MPFALGGAIMSETIGGMLRVSNGCIADIAGYAAMECYGVVGMAQIDEVSGIAQLLPQPVLRRGVEVSSHDGRLRVDLHVVVERGINLASVAANLSSSVKYLLAEVAQIQDVDVQIHVEGMRAN